MRPRPARDRRRPGACVPSERQIVASRRDGRGGAARGRARPARPRPAQRDSSPARRRVRREPGDRSARRRSRAAIAVSMARRRSRSVPRSVASVTRARASSMISSTICSLSRRCSPGVKWSQPRAPPRVSLGPHTEASKCLARLVETLPQVLRRGPGRIEQELGLGELAIE